MTGSVGAGAGSFHDVLVDELIFTEQNILDNPYDGPNPDLLLARLVTPVTHIDYVPFATDQEILASIGQTAYMAGWSTDDLRFCPDFQVSASSGTLPTYLDRYKTTITQTGTCGAGIGDSGGAVLVDITDPITQTSQLKHVGVLVTNIFAARHTMHEYYETDCDWARYGYRILPDEPCKEDINKDGFVDANDLAALLAAWGRCPCDAPCPADFNNDEDANSTEMAMLLAAWGICDE